MKTFFWIHFLTSDDDGWIIETFNSFFYTSSHTEKHTIVFSQYYYYIPNLSLFSLWHWNWNRNFMQRWSDNCQYFKFLFNYRSTNCFDDRIFFMPYTKPRKESIKKLQEEKINFTKKNKVWLAKTLDAYGLRGALLFLVWFYGIFASI